MNDTAEPSPENRGKSLICALSAYRSLNWKRGDILGKRNGSRSRETLKIAEKRLTNIVQKRRAGWDARSKKGRMTGASS